MRALCLSTALIAAASTHLAGQDTKVYTYRPSTEVREWQQLHGQRLRVVDAQGDGGTALEGVLRGSRGDTLLLRVPGRAAPVRVVAAPGIEVEQWRRSDPTTSMSVAIGLVGAIAGGITANALNEPPPQRRCRSFDDDVTAMACGIGAGIASGIEGTVDQIGALLAGVAIGGVVGVLAGRRIGRSMIEEGWRPVSRPRVTVRPTSRGSLQFGIQVPH